MGELTWKSEFPESYDVPSLIEKFVRKGLMDDFSWHNDMSPSFAVKDPKSEDRGIRIWVDHPIASAREVPGGERFMLQEGEFGSEHEQEFNSDDLEEILIKLFEWLNKGQYNRSNFRSQKWWVKGEPDETMKELIQDYKL